MVNPVECKAAAACQVTDSGGGVGADLEYAVPAGDHVRYPVGRRRVAELADRAGRAVASRVGSLAPRGRGAVVLTWRKRLSARGRRFVVRGHLRGAAMPFVRASRIAVAPEQASEITRPDGDSSLSGAAVAPFGFSEVTAIGEQRAEVVRREAVPGARGSAVPLLRLPCLAAVLERGAEIVGTGRISGLRRDPQPALGLGGVTLLTQEVAEVIRRLAMAMPGCLPVPSLGILGIPLVPAQPSSEPLPTARRYQRSASARSSAL